MEAEDQRITELYTLSAIFPEIQRVHEDDPYTFVLEVPVNPPKAVKVFFPATTGGQNPNPATVHTDSSQLGHLPAVRLHVSLPPSYPTEKPPAVSVSTSPPWLPSSTTKKLEDDCVRLWDELGRDLVVFTYIDHVQQSADDVFGLVSDGGTLEIIPEHKIAILDYDIQAKRAAFENRTFECNVCLEPKSGAKCHRMLDCEHVFCTQCLQYCYNNAIKEGDLASVRCMEPGCAKEREAAQAPGKNQRRKLKTFISPNELLQIRLAPEMVERYVRLKYKAELESDKKTIYCPRTWCQGAAKSEKHKKPEGFELHEAEEDSDSEPENEPPKPEIFRIRDKLAVCEDCGFAFCSNCYKSWHGEFQICTSKREPEHLTKEGKASLEFIRLNTSPCPTCASPVQKTEGCNHIICYKCQTHFCYLCSAWLDASNPYQHYNPLTNAESPCSMRLWELQQGGEVRDAVEEEIAPIALEEGIARDEGINNDRGRRVPNLEVAREGPLRLRLYVSDPPAQGGRRGQQGPAPRGIPQQAQNPNPRPIHQERQNMVRQDQPTNEQLREEAGEDEELQAREAAWVRRFVQLAIDDNEDLIDEDDD